MEWRQPLERLGFEILLANSAMLFSAPEGRRKLAGGGAKRNHRDKSKKFVRVPACTPDQNSQQDQSRSGALSGRVVLSYRFRWLRHRLISLAPPALKEFASGIALTPHSKGSADPIYEHASVNCKEA